MNVPVRKIVCLYHVIKMALSGQVSLTKRTAAGHMA
jgi:hypothetical protein